MNLFLDIETLPADAADIRAELAASILPPKTMSKPETIARWEAEDKPALVEQVIRNTALDGAFGRVLAIGYAANDDAVHALIGEENFVLENFYAALKAEASAGRMRDGGSITFIGHNVLSFDLRFLWQRSIINGVPVPPSFAAAVRAKPWAETVADTMVLWNPERDRKISLKKLCRALGVPNPKANLESANVYDAFKRGELDLISELVRADVEAVRACFYRMTGKPVVIRQAAAV